MRAGAAPQARQVEIDVAADPRAKKHVRGHLYLVYNGTAITREFINVG